MMPKAVILTMPGFEIPPFTTIKWRFAATALLFVSLTIYLGYFTHRDHFAPFIAGYAAFFVLYCRVSFFKTPIPVLWLIALGIALRVLLLFSLPNLSDDYFRFLWDGRLAVAGYHPFLHTPRYFMEHQILPPGITPALFSQLNSPDYYTVYPTVCQVVFAAAAFLAPENNWLGVVLIKLPLFAAEIGTIWLLWNAEPAKQPDETIGLSAIMRRPQAALLYALNPLLILEIAGNCHFEGVMIFFLLLGILAIRSLKIGKASVYWALATATKMVPVLFLPVLWRWLGGRKGLKFQMLFGLSVLVLFAPLIAVLPNIAKSLDLYFQKFQFNASVYYLVREVGYSKIGWDIGESSGPIMGLATVFGVLLIALLVGRKTENADARLAGAMLFSLLLYQSMAAVVQPWYVCVPLAISLLTRWRFAVLWSGVVALSYSHYDGGLRQEHFGLIAVEYSTLWGFIIWELWQFFRRK